MAAISGIVLAGVAVAGTAYSAVEQRKAGKEAKKANEKSQRIEAVRAQRERVNTIRQQRIANASVVQAGAASGTLGSSGTQGALAGYNTQVAANVNFTDQLNTLNQQRMQALSRQEGYSGNASMGQSIAGLAGQALPYAK